MESDLHAASWEPHSVYIDSSATVNSRRARPGMTSSRMGRARQKLAWEFACRRSEITTTSVEYRPSHGPGAKERSDVALEVHLSRSQL